MLCIPDSSTNTWIANQISQQGYSYSWIGYSDLPNNDGNYEWVSGCSSSYSNSYYGNNYYSYDYVYISLYSGAWSSTYDYGFFSITCSCQHSFAPTLLPTLSPTPIPTSLPSSVIIGIVVGCVVFIIMVILILKYFFCKRTNQVCISTINESSSNNDNINSSDQAYTDIPPTCPYPPSDDDDDGIVISSSTIELQVIVASDAYYNDVVQVDHEQELLPVAVQV